MPPDPGPAAHAIIGAHGLFKNYGGIKVLKDVSFEVSPRETLAIIGPNGAGKTTLFKTLTGEVLPSQGTVSYHGNDITRMSVSDRSRNGIGRTFQVARVFPASTVLGNAVVAVEARRRSAGESVGLFRGVAPLPAVKEEAASWLEQVGLKDRLGLDACFLSHGDKKRLEIAVALCLRPRVMMMDEPTAGMSPADRAGARDLVAELRERLGLTVLLTEHDMDVVFTLASRIMVLNYGEVVAIGTPEEVRNHEAVRAVYLGEDMQDA